MEKSQGVSHHKDIGKINGGEGDQEGAGRHGKGEETQNEFNKIILCACRDIPQ